MKVSVIIPVYNAEKYLPQALDSVLAQTFTDYECVCVNDGSTDDSAAILTRYEQKFKEAGRTLRIITKENGGEGSARNVGMDEARGEYITWLDADDVLAPTRFDVAAKIIDQADPDLLRMYYQMGADAPEEFSVAPEYSYEVMTDKRRIFRWCWRELNGDGMVWLWFAKRQLLEGLRFRPEMRVKTDCVFSSSLIPKIGKLCINNDVGLYYRVLPTSMFNSARKAVDCVNCQQAFLDLWNEQRDYAESIGELEYFKDRIAWCAQSDLLDWVRMRPAAETSSDGALVREAYVKIMESGAFSGRFVLKPRYRVSLPLYNAFGWLWPIQLTETLLIAFRRLFRNGGHVDAA